MTAIPPLLPRIAHGDQAAVKLCIERYGGLIWSLARRLCPADAEDAVQEIFIDIWKNANRFDPEKSSEKTFVAMIARRRLIDRVRHAGRRPEQVGLADTPELSRPPGMEEATDVAIASRAINEMNPDQRRILWLSLHAGMSHAEIAEVTGTALGTVKSHIRRGLVTIREKLSMMGKETERRVAR
ncbi:Sigma-70 family RNA polymerase sigma factor [Sulfidibacter corallicola]|uniref:Sigma-70 family RNA polymerase sigma factor n=1 Tax=Sulfidibacter corallicola TaxID=2818388 RepID=A0A8A4TNG1_SULCO|nr:sigma-70 family RNA polymerase sigma factor [Sulfidibacter corallicola]QTD50431.1 sigma-70 family RNA polymerase sigma factor [Sulfidibacter corallicola]